MKISLFLANYIQMRNLLWPFPVLGKVDLKRFIVFRRVRVALDHIPQPVLKSRIAPTQMQDPTLGLAEPHEVHTGLLLQVVQVPLDDIPSFWRVNCTTQLGVICKLAEGALDLAINVIDENIEQHWSLYRPLYRTPLITDLHLDIEPLTATLNQFLIY
ncbi:hypothetical protein QYF61_007229 [Mycteria americana]|uniref:Uncharacterized protein n=1 Tax=Mycteria americana TaxID=33587 RepID=A0AAN7MY53_MYCAM|nr:hypothetical protein QYF61_007229 [Mycteria americana]